ncbi:GntR family transcriptional regulator [Clostridium aminobutyricum]|uniref:GntR family transcriptional regulator n=1 Tax=Clostridium aminobutyricum TaxID=33953 RepID=A0A939D9N1_CLOAM|nr:GntR family transcriptional regulator [Clostridium aminobutyricum]MBN7773318.1 GntR family transcriptional regulator [Clostridium aminobutyricum]
MEKNKNESEIVHNGISENLPAYIKVMEIIRRNIISGMMQPNEKIQSIKELAQKYKVNPNTVQRALTALEKEGLLRSHRTAGRYVTENKLLIKSIRNMEARKITDEFVAQLRNLAIKPEELVELFAGPIKTEAQEETA